MARENMMELLSETICVTQAEAAAALEARDWNVLEAAQLLQQQARARARREREARAGRPVVRQTVPPVFPVVILRTKKRPPQGMHLWAGRDVCGTLLLLAFLAEIRIHGNLQLIIREGLLHVGNDF